MRGDENLYMGRHNLMHHRLSKCIVWIFNFEYRNETWHFGKKNANTFQFNKNYNHADVL